MGCAEWLGWMPLEMALKVLYSPFVSYQPENGKCAAEAVATGNRRRHDRVPGPFDGRRVASLATPVRIYDLSEGGCFVTSFHDQQPGVGFWLEIDLPYEGWIRVKAETLYVRPGFGFAVRFTEMTQGTAERLRWSLSQLISAPEYDR
jgi:hypothetical protein